MKFLTAHSFRIFLQSIIVLCVIIVNFKRYEFYGQAFELEAEDASGAAYGMGLLLDAFVSGIAAFLIYALWHFTLSKVRFSKITLSIVMIGIAWPVLAILTTLIVK